MENEFVPYEEALALKELGFDEPCVAFYEQSKRLSIGFNWLNEGGKNSNLQECTAPLYQQAFRWFREKHEILFEFTNFPKDGNRKTDPMMWEYNIICKPYHSGNYIHDGGDGFETYEEAELACLKKLIEIVKDENRI